MPSTQAVRAIAVPPGLERSALEKFEALQVSDIPGLEDKAAAGDAEAQFLLGLVLRAWDVPKDVKKGLALYEQSALQGFRPAQDFLAEQHWAGTDIKRDYAAAFKWWSAAAEQGSEGPNSTWQ